MNGRQVTVLIGVALFVLVGLFPPWVAYDWDASAHATHAKPIGMWFLLGAPPGWTHGSDPIGVDWGRLGAAWAVIAVATLVVCGVLRRN